MHHFRIENLAHRNKCKTSMIYLDEFCIGGFVLACINSLTKVELFFIKYMFPCRWFLPEVVPTLSWCTDKMPTQPWINSAEGLLKSTRKPLRYPNQPFLHVGSFYGWRCLVRVIIVYYMTLLNTFSIHFYSNQEHKQFVTEPTILIVYNAKFIKKLD